MRFNFTKREKTLLIILGLVALIGITAYVSGGVNGQKISSISFTLIFAIIGIGAIITMIRSRMRYQNYITSQYDQQSHNEKDDTRQKREKEERQKEDENRDREKEERYEQKENYSEQNNPNAGLEKYYYVLHLKPGASKQEIKKKYRELSQMIHPDKNPGNKNSDEYQKELNEAYDALIK